MRIRKEYWYYAGAAALLLLMAKLSKGYNLITDWLIPELEGFLSTPKWDNKQYTWGYGTRAPAPTGVITKSQALADMRAYLLNDYNALRPLIVPKLTASQWAAFLSFSYNEGRENAKNLIPEINSGDQAALEQNWKLYIYSNHVVSSNLIARRDTEWQVWQGYF